MFKVKDGYDPLALEKLYSRRENLLKEGYDFLSDEIESVEKEILEMEYLPDFEEVIEMISTGKMRSVFGCN